MELSYFFEAGIIIMYMCILQQNYLYDLVELKWKPEPAKTISFIPKNLIIEESIEQGKMHCVENTW